jgi:hypothetical protein
MTNDLQRQDQRRILVSPPGGHTGAQEGDDEMSDVQREVPRYLNAVGPRVRAGTVSLAAIGR